MFIFFSIAENKGQVLPLGRILNTLLVPRMLTLEKKTKKTNSTLKARSVLSKAIIMHTSTQDVEIKKNSKIGV